MTKHCREMLVEMHGLTPDEAKVMVRDLNAAAARSPLAGRVSASLKRVAKEEAARLRERASRKKLNARKQALNNSTLFSDIEAAPNIWKRIAAIMVGDNIQITVVDIRGDKVRLGIVAPIEIPVHRKEVYDAIQRENRNASNLEPKDLAKPSGENSRGSKRR